jgi:hypothetical protein
MMANAKLLVAAALLSVGAAGCSDLTGNVNAEGGYLLKELSDQSGTTICPCEFTDQGGNDIVVTQDVYGLNSDGSYTEVRIQTVNGIQESPQEFGTWSQSGNTVFLRPTQSDFDLSPYQGTIRNSNEFGGNRTLTISINGNTAIYSD